MVSINSLREFLAECKSGFKEINRCQLLYDDSTIVEFLKDYSASDNIFMLGIIPQFDSTGNNPDSVKMRNNLAFLFLEMVNYNDLNYHQELQVFHRTLELAKKFIQKLQEEAGSSSCHEMNLIDWDSIGINPVKNLASCNGYEVEFSLKTNI